jgi:hypothetical protein
MLRAVSDSSLACADRVRARGSTGATLVEGDVIGGRFARSRGRGLQSKLELVVAAAADTEVDEKDAALSGADCFRSIRFFESGWMHYLS